nr:PREDICTED: uncharacterized protein LOC107795561 [Nicotiana tabacum]
MRLENGKKQCYMGHRHFLPLNHKWRNDKQSFDGTKERRLPPNILSGEDILDQVADLDGLPLTKDPKKKPKISHESRGDNWNKKSIFFDLSYWKTLLLRHNLDVMHIEKNVCENILGTILNVKGKTKDTIKARLDLQAKNIRKELHPIKNGEKYELPTTYYTLSPYEKNIFLRFLKNLKVPDGYSSNISQCVNTEDCKISGIKSHDCHVLLQHLLLLAIRGMLCKSVCEPLLELSLFFNLLGAKYLRMEELEQRTAQIPITLCKLEKVFPPSFFDVMVHLPIHLANETMIAGTIQYRWMYPVERWLYILKSLVGNRAFSKGSIAEGYLATECLTLCSRYLHTMETKFNRLEQNYDGGIIKSDGGDTSQKHSNKEFISWFKKKVVELYKCDNSKKMEDLLTLSRGPLPYVRRLKGYVTDGYRFHVEDYDRGLRTQNYGVIVVGETDDENKNIDYYGELTVIFELQFIGGKRVILFRCMWFDLYDQEKRVKMDEYGFVSVSCQRLLKTNEPFVLANQALQVFYVDDPSNKGWHVARKVLPHDTFDILQEKDDDLENLDNSTQMKRKRTDEVF